MLSNDKWNYGRLTADPIIGPQGADIWDAVSASSEAILVAGLTLAGFFMMMIIGLGSLAMKKLHCEPPEVLCASM